ncbi:16S rRNA (cytidine(1402)-2'-O)-methyltransferase [Campylobacter sp.]|uniref:16S rRNA (cytidine(1402)-2'-O)-methyltransferase n=1 Tax=Campylobacter sp. TaxID=205 RepID=UPI0027044AB0|nr:16S rRNA (cytidine(1402)-2'-O)-methyltransferase [Campylobacter sp.]
MLYFIPTPIGNLDDVSLRALNVLRECEIVFCEDTRVTKALINLLNTKFNSNINIQKFIPLHSHNEAQILSNLDMEIFKKNVAYLSDAGMPAISDPGVELVRFAIKNGIDYEVLSGSNALLLAVVASGICEKEFTFLGFLPNTGKERTIAIQNALNSPYPVVIYESPKRILSLVKQIANSDPNRELFIIKEATKKFETKFSATAQKLKDELKNANLKGEWSVVIDKSPYKTSEKITLDDILALEIPPKTKAKLISKITGEEVKKIYENLTK